MVDMGCHVHILCHVYAVTNDSSRESRVIVSRQTTNNTKTDNRNLFTFLLLFRTFPRQALVSSCQPRPKDKTYLAAMDFTRIRLLDGELFNGLNELNLADVTLTGETVQHIIEDRLDRFDVEEIHLCDVSFATTFDFFTFLFALQELSTLDRLTWHSPLTISQWKSFADIWETGQLDELDIEWKILPNQQSEDDRNPNNNHDDDDEDDDDDEALSEIFANLFRATEEKLVLRMGSESRIDVPAFFSGFQRGRQEKIDYTTNPDVTISLHTHFSSLQHFASWVQHIRTNPKMVSSFKVDAMQLCNASISMLGSLLKDAEILNLVLSDCSIPAAVAAPTLECLTNAFADNTTLKRLVLCSVHETKHALWSAFFRAFRGNKSLENLQLTTAESSEGSTLLYPFVAELPFMQSLRVLETRWCEGMGDVLLPGLRANISLHDIVLDGLGGDDPTNNEDELRQCLDRNRLFHEMTFVKSDDDDLFASLNFLACQDMGQSGTALYYIIRFTLLPQLVATNRVANRGGKRKRPTSTSLKI
eukprot:scaffold7825_cov162-Amphora_coffeaeformis.AAC.14